MTTEFDFTHLLWVDFETTSPDPTTTLVLEAAAILTTLNPTEELGWFDGLVWGRSYDDLMMMIQNLDPYVLKMHTDNGLLNDLRASVGPEIRDLSDMGMSLRPAYPIPAVDRIWSAMLEANDVEPGKVLIAGSGVDRFDHVIIDRCLPQTAKFLHYAAIDLSSMRRFLQLLGLDWMLPKKEVPHRAFLDLLMFKEQAAMFGDMLTRAAVLINPNKEQS